MVGLYCPYTRRPLTPSCPRTPVNHIPGIHQVRAELARISSHRGGMSFWHSRYTCSQNHLRQQVVVSRLVDGLLAYGWAEMARRRRRLLGRSLSITWKTELLLMPTLVRMAAVGPITGDPELWSRRLARNIDRRGLPDSPRQRVRFLAWTRGRLPWGATAETLISTTPTGDVNEKKVAVAEWHETNQRNTEDIVILKYHDRRDAAAVRARTFGYNDEHEHDPLA